MPENNMKMLSTSVFASICLALLDGAVAFSSLQLRPGVTTRGPSPAATAGTSLSAVREATFGMGCFWEPAESLLKKPGVVATTVGYTGAPPNKPVPTYDSVCFGNDWVEGVRVAYDDDVCDYGQLLDHFYECQKPGYSRQYASVVFCNDAEEEKMATQWKKDRASNNLAYDIVQIEPVSSFYRAEEYHQRYWEKQRFRYLIGLLLIGGESGAFDKYLSGFLGSTDLFGVSFDTVFGGAFLAGAGWMLLERAVSGKDVRELKQGDLAATALQN